MLAKLNILKHVVKINLAEDKCLLEPYVLNGTCTVLMRGQGSNSLSLSDQELEFFKYQNFDKTLDIIRFELTDMDLKIEEYKLYLLFKLID